MKTIGIVAVPCFAARAAGALTAKMTSTFRLSQLANEFRKSFASTFGPPLNENNVLSVYITVFAHPFTEGVKEVLVRGRGLRNPIFQTFADCWARAVVGHENHAVAPPSSVMNSRRLMRGGSG